MKGKYTKESSLDLLKSKQRELTSQGIVRYPKRADFTNEEVMAVKAFYGPWSRALEAAGLKPPRNDERKEQNKEKRIRAKRQRIKALKEAKEASKTVSGSAEISHPEKSET